MHFPVRAYVAPHAIGVMTANVYVRKGVLLLPLL